MYASYDHKLNIWVVGDPGVGKTCLCDRYLYDTYVNAYYGGVGHSIPYAYDKKVDYNDEIVKLTICDASGCEIYPTSTQARLVGVNSEMMGGYYPKLCMLVFDLTLKQSFENLPIWIKWLDMVEDCGVIIVGTQSDLISKREVAYNKAKAFADSKKLAYFENFCER